MTTVLAAHVGHRCEPLDDRRLRCHDCSHTLVLTQPAQSTSTSTSVIPGKDDPTCPTHGHYAGTCRGCAADAKAAPDIDEHGRRDVDRPVTADVAARAAEARALLPPPRPTPRRTHVDRERLTQAKAELDAHHRPEPEATCPT